MGLRRARRGGRGVPLWGERAWGRDRALILSWCLDTSECGFFLLFPFDFAVWCTCPMFSPADCTFSCRFGTFRTFFCPMLSCAFCAGWALFADSCYVSILLAVKASSYFCFRKVSNAVFDFSFMNKAVCNDAVCRNWAACFEDE